jgi:hypothetical protein
MWKKYEFANGLARFSGNNGLNCISLMFLNELNVRCVIWFDSFMKIS